MIGQLSGWLDFDPALPSDIANKILSATSAIRPANVQSGVVLFSLKVGLWGGQEPAATMPALKEWKALAMMFGRPAEAGELAEAAWTQEEH